MQWLQYRDRVGRIEEWHAAVPVVRWLDPDTVFDLAVPEQFYSSCMIVLPDEPLLTARQAAAYLGVTRQRIYQLNRGSAFGHYRYPCLISPSQLDNYRSTKGNVV